MGDTGSSDALAGIERLRADFPYWHVWVGIAGLLYARRPKSSPPKVVRGKDVTALRERILDSDKLR